jgi:acyl dehydratase
MPEGVVVGYEIPTFTREATLHHWNRYAAVNDEFYDIHMDDESAKAAGHATAIGMGNIQWAYMHNMLRDWLSDRGRLLTLSCEFRRPSLRNSIVRARGVVRSIRAKDGCEEMELEVWTENSSGERMAQGKATIVRESP